MDHRYESFRADALGGDRQFGIRLASSQTQAAPTSVSQRESSADARHQAALVTSASSYPVPSQNHLERNFASMHVTTGCDFPEQAETTFLPHKVGERQGLTSRAAQDLSGADSQELENLAWDFIHHATIGIEEAGAAAQDCLRLLETQNGGTRFLYRLYKCCGTVFVNREWLLPDMAPTQAPQGWTAYVFFVAELVLGLGRRSHVASGAASSTTTKEEAIARRLARLLCQAGLVILRAPCMGHPTEVECLRTVITTSGGTVKRLSPEGMATLTGRLRRAVEERASDQIGAILVDVLTQSNAV